MSKALWLLWVTASDVAAQDDVDLDKRLLIIQMAVDRGNCPQIRSLLPEIQERYPGHPDVALTEAQALACEARWVEAYAATRRARAAGANAEALRAVEARTVENLALVRVGVRVSTGEALPNPFPKPRATGPRGDMLEGFPEEDGRYVFALPPGAYSFQVPLDPESNFLRSNSTPLARYEPGTSNTLSIDVLEIPSVMLRAPTGLPRNVTLTVEGRALGTEPIRIAAGKHQVSTTLVSGQAPVGTVSHASWIEEVVSDATLHVPSTMSVLSPRGELLAFASFAPDAGNVSLQEMRVRHRGTTVRVTGDVQITSGTARTYTLDVDATVRTWQRARARAVSFTMGGLGLAAAAYSGAFAANEQIQADAAVARGIDDPNAVARYDAAVASVKSWEKVGVAMVAGSVMSLGVAGYGIVSMLKVLKEPTVDVGVLQVDPVRE